MTRPASKNIPWKETGHAGLTHACFIQEGEQLWVAYASGNVYRFSGVPKRWYDELMKAAKPAQYVDRHIKQRFDMRRLHGFKPVT